MIKQKVNFINSKKILKIDLGKLIFLFTTLYSVFYFGAFPSKTKSLGFIYEYFLLFSPSIIGYFLISYFKEDQIKVSIHFKKFIFGFSLFLIFLIFKLNDFCLVGDEISYSFKSYCVTLTGFEVEKYICWGTPNDLRTYEYWQEFHKSQKF